MFCLCTNYSQRKRLYSYVFLVYSLVFLFYCCLCFVSCFVLMKKEQQTQQEHVHLMSEDDAAGLRKQLIRFHCISCDRPIDVQPHSFVSFVIIYLFSQNTITFFFLKSFFFSFIISRQQPSLPANQGMRPIQSPRPYTTFELDQIRQFQKR
jgi:hypothetical protein